MAKQFVVIRDMSAGNGAVGEMWQETKVFGPGSTLSEVMDWADERSLDEDYHSRRKVTLTVAHP